MKHPSPIYSLLAVGLLAAILTQQTATAQTTPSQGVGGTVNSPDSVLHGRTIKVADTILDALGSGITRYNQVTNLAQLSSITSLSFFGEASEDWSPRAGDFDGLVNLQSLSLTSLNFRLTSLPLGIFDDLVNLQTLEMINQHLATLPAGIFDNLVNLRTLDLFQSFALATLPAGIFDNLDNLQTLRICCSGLTTLPAGIFDNLVNLRTLTLENNGLTTLPAGIFDNLANLQSLDLTNNQLTFLPAGIFDGLPESLSARLTTQYAQYFRGPYISLSPLRVREGERTFPFSQSYNVARDSYIGVGETEEFSIKVEVSQTLTVYSTGSTDVYGYLLDNSRRVLAQDDSSGAGPNFRISHQVSPGTYYVRVRHYFQSGTGGYTLHYNLLHPGPSLEEKEVYAEFQVQLRNAPYSEDITFDYTTRDGTATAGQDYIATSGTISIPAGTTNFIQTISIPILDDNVDDPVEETFHLILRNPLNVAFSRDGLTTYSATITIVEAGVEDPPTPILNFAQSAFLSLPEGNEGETTASLNIQLLNGIPTEDVSVDYATREGTATAGEDYIETSGTLTFSAFTTNLTQAISIPILGDTDFEPNEYLNILLSNPTNAIIHLSTARIEIVNDDSAAPPLVPLPGRVTLPSLMFQTTSLSLREGGSATYQVRATSSQNREMAVNIKTTHPGITVNPSKLMFNPINWQNYQTVTVTASADAADTNKEAYIMHSIPASEGFIARNDAGAVSLTIAHKVMEKPNSQDSVDPEEPVAPEHQLPPTDYDRDDDGLIDIRNLAQLHALRWDLNGDGQPDKEEYMANYKQAFPSAIANMGIPNHILAQGYELTTNLNFDTNRDQTINEEDAFWNKGNGWESIGSFSQPFQAVLEGNGHKISNLFQDQSEAAVFINEPSGLFGVLGNRGQVVGLVLEGAEIKGVNWVGALAGLSQGVLVNCSVRGRVVGYNSVGGLVGHNFGEIADSHVRGEVRGNIWVGGLVGWNAGGWIEGSSAQGEEALGLVGFGTPAAR